MKRNIVEVCITGYDDAESEFIETSVNHKQFIKCIDVMKLLRGIMDYGEYQDISGRKSNDNPFHENWWKSDRPKKEFDEDNTDGLTTTAKAKKFWDKYKFAFDGKDGEVDMSMVYELVKKIDPKAKPIKFKPTYTVEI